MMAANLAVLCSMSVEEVENARMAAEEAFVYACATEPKVCRIDFAVSDDAIDMTFALGSASVTNDASRAEQVGLAKVLLEAVSDSYEILSDVLTLSVSKLTGGFDGQ
jgi:serine/threonine-protein kinase RsbW